MTVYDGLFTLKCCTSIVPGHGLLDLREADSVGTLLHRPEIDAEDPEPLYSLSIDGSSTSSPSTSSPSGEEPSLPTLYLIDPLSKSPLASVATLSPNKLRLVTLHNPTSHIELKNKSLLSYEWSFVYQDCKFIWNRSRDSLSTRDSGYTCKLVRKPDPDVAVAVYKLAKKGNLVQILDYNLDRFNIEDRKGLEVLLLSTLFALLYADQLDAAPSGDVPATSPSTTPGASGLPSSLSSQAPSPRPLPQRKKSQHEVETKEDSPNEIVISTRLEEGLYVTHCLNMLSDPTLIYLTLVAETPETVPRAISIASDIKRRRMKEGREDLMQFVDYPGRASDASSPRQPLSATPRRNSGNERAAPPASIKVYLSRIPLEELTPRQRPANPGGGKANEKGQQQLPRPSLPERQGQRSNHQGRAPPPPLPPKTHSSQEADHNGRKRGFWQRAMSG